MTVGTKTKEPWTWRDEDTIERILAAGCAYARGTGRHKCGETGCYPTDWQGYKREVVKAVVGELWTLLTEAEHDAKACGCEAHLRIDARLKALERLELPPDPPEARWHRRGTEEAARCPCCRQEYPWETEARRIGASA